ncbi:hypothetical protein NHX12_026213 [Muraenolepis orangiensis]|uniref:5'-nucleotidase n=1 Tax=Muraenolepis orangiensis TaxID=630683 RepID=A0A9Q0EG52_9TELE|nr:hypothetical protein NHX12_026213 [Muraenolepis orangiensis]
MVSSPWTLRASLLLLCCLWLGPSAAASWDLVLLHTNDVHARVEATSRGSGRCAPAKAPCFAGVARRASKVAEVRGREANVLLLDAGDQYQGSVWFNMYKGAEAAHFMNLLRYDAMALGNHEFDNGVEGLQRPFLEKVGFPVLSANIYNTTPPTQANKPYFVQPYAVLTVGGQEVGVVGYTSQETPALSNPGPNLKFEDEVSAIQLQVDKLRSLGVNKIIALGHSGFTADQEIARRVRGVDVVIGGHSNTFLDPSVLGSDEGRQVPVVQAYAFGKYLGYLKVTFDGAGDVVKASGNPILLDSSVPEDASVKGEVDAWRRNLTEYSSRKVGRTLVFLNGTFEECRFRECNLGNLICDAMVDNNIKYPDDLQWNHVSASILNGGGVRNSIDERTADGDITVEDLIAVLPFGGTFDLVELRGGTLRRAFEHAVHRYGHNSGEFLQVSGIRVEYDLASDPGRRVRSLQLLCIECRVPRYEEVREEAVYKVVLSSYLATGGDGFSMIQDEKLKHDSGDMDISVLETYIAERKRVHPAIEDRITFFKAPPRDPATRPAAQLLAVLLGLACSLY